LRRIRDRDAQLRMYDVEADLRRVQLQRPVRASSCSSGPSRRCRAHQSGCPRWRSCRRGCSARRCQQQWK
jgi:hypothetical protein